MSVARQEKKLITAEELWEMPEVPGKMLELVDGEIVQVPGANPLHGLIVELLLRLIGAHVRERDLGLTFGDGTGYVVRRDPDRMRIPDVSFVSWERVPGGEVPEEGFWPLAPDLAVEVVSPGDRAADVHDKVQEYLQAGSRMVLVLWPKSQSITLYEQGVTARELGAEDEFKGGDVLPDFRVRVAEFFDVRRSR